MRCAAELQLLTTGLHGVLKHYCRHCSALFSWKWCCFSFLQVEITLQDVNDNPPVFPTDILDVTIEENIGDGFKIMQLTATDADEVHFSQEFIFSYTVHIFLADCKSMWRMLAVINCLHGYGIDQVKQTVVLDQFRIPKTLLFCKKKNQLWWILMNSGV